MKNTCQSKWVQKPAWFEAKVIRSKVCFKNSSYTLITVLTKDKRELPLIVSNDKEWIRIGFSYLFRLSQITYCGFIWSQIEPLKWVKKRRLAREGKSTLYVKSVSFCNGKPLITLTFPNSAGLKREVVTVQPLNRYIPIPVPGNSFRPLL